MMPGRSVMTGAKPGGSTGMTTNFASMHWRDPRAFRSEEGRRREINRVASNAGNLNNKLFLSHCWRKTSRQEGDEDLQAKKRQMIAHLSTPSKVGGRAGNTVVFHYCSFLYKIQPGLTQDGV